MASSIYPYPSTLNVGSFVSIKLTKGNYLLWKTQMLCLIESQDFHGFIDGTVQAPDSSSAANHDYLLWRRSDRLLKGWILGSLSADVLATVVGLNTARDVWTKLQHFQNENKSQTSQLETDHEVDLKHYQPLHQAAYEGDWTSAEKFLSRNPSALTAIISLKGMNLLQVAAASGQPEFVRKLMEMELMSTEALEMQDKKGFTALHYIAMTGDVKAAKEMVRRNPNLPNIASPVGETPLYAATWDGHSDREEMVRYLCGVTKDGHPHNPLTSPFNGQLIYRIVVAGYYANWSLNDRLRRTIVQMTPYRKKVKYAKLRHKGALELAEFICQRALDMNNSEMLDFILGSELMINATRHGAVEIVRLCLKYFPDMILSYRKCEHNLLLVVIEYRQHEIFNLIFKKKAPHLEDFFCNDESGNTPLHLAARLAPSSQLYVDSGAVLEMLRELQWFKEVENLVNPMCKLMTNDDGKTPEEIFTEQHNDLFANGEKWMKDTSNSCMLVSTLIATVVFAAAFTVPGGNDSNGIPIFINRNTFVLFAISDALALFFSTNSILHFLSILKSRNAQGDFLAKLPRKLIIGVFSLLVAIATMMVAFVAALSIVLSERLKWIIIPLILLACFSVGLFTKLNLPLFVQLTTSTYGPGLLFPKKKEP